MRSRLVTLAIVGAVLAAGVMLLPKGFSDDTSKIGRGIPVVVLTHDRNTVYSQQVMELMNKVRNDYAGRFEFVVVDLGSEKDRAFLQQQRVSSVLLLVFSPDGRRLADLDNVTEEHALRAALDRVLAGS
jgi:thioredoxin-like negative regulator of GroEL